MTKYGELTVISGECEGLSFELILHDQLTLGRGAEADFRLKDRSMSREQFMICVGRDHCLIQELGSKNGTFINGERLAGTQILQDRDRIRVGRHELRVGLIDVVQRKLFCSACNGVIDVALEDAADPDASVQICLICQYLEVAEEDCPFDSLLVEEAGEDPPSKILRNRIGPYRIEERLGKGGSSVVYKGVDERSKRYVALKLLRPRADKRARFERFLHEARLVASLYHPAIVGCYDLGHDAGVMYMALEYVEGQDLERLLRRSGVPPMHQALDWGIQLAGALQYAQAKGVIHRDLKLANLLLDRRGRIKVIDFGIARALDLSGTRVTQTDQFLGTPQYMAPEQISDVKRVDHRADIFAVGVILYRLIAGQSPYPKTETTAQLLRLKLSDDATHPLRKFCPEIPQSVEAVIGKAMAHRPEDRFDDARELAQALQDCLRDVDRPLSQRLPVILPQKLREGDVVSATVSQVESYGAFLSHEQARIFVGMTEWTWTPGEADFELCAVVGAKVEIKLIEWVAEQGHWLGSVREARA